MEESISLNEKEKTVSQPRDYQIYAIQVLNWEVADLLRDEDIKC